MAGMLGGGGGTDFTLHFIFNRGGYLIPWLHCVVYILYCIYIDWDLCGLSNLGKSRPGGGNRNQEEEVQFRKEEDMEYEDKDRKRKQMTRI